MIHWYFALYHVDVSNSKVATGKFHMKFVVAICPCMCAIIDNVCIPNGLETHVKLFSYEYPSFSVPITLGNVQSGCLAFSQDQFEGMDIPFTLFFVLCCVLNKNTACLWTLGEILFATSDNGRYSPANNSATVLLAIFLYMLLHLHNQRNV